MIRAQTAASPQRLHAQSTHKKSVKFNGEIKRLENISEAKVQRTFSPEPKNTPLIKMMQRYTIRYMDKILFPKGDTYQDMSTRCTSPLPKLS